MCTLRISCQHKCVPRLHKLRLSRRMHSSRAAAFTQQLWCKVEDPGGNSVYTIQVKRKQLPMTIKTASTINTLQGVTTDPGLIFHWKFPRFFSEELRWLATYVALSRPPSLAQLISVGLPDELRNIIEGGPPEGILSRFNDMFKEKEEATQLRAAEVMRELGWDATD